MNELTTQQKTSASYSYIIGLFYSVYKVITLYYYRSHNDPLNSKKYKTPAFRSFSTKGTEGRCTFV